MPMIRIPAEFTFQQCERVLDALEGAPHEPQLVLPTNARHAHIGGSAAVAQVLGTWAQRNQTNLVTFAEDNAQITDLISRLHGVVAALYSSSVASLGSKQNLTEQMFTAAVERLDRMQGVEPLRSRGMVFELLCADHLARSRPKLFYRQISSTETQIRDPKEFASIVERVGNIVLPEGYRARAEAEQHEAIGGLIYEIFKNTEDHAMFDHLGNKLRRSVRGVTFRHHLLLPKELSKLAGDLGALHAFCERTHPPILGAQKLRLLEFSVFDSGPGYASRLLGRELHSMSLDEEFAAVQKCFQTGVSTKKDTAYGQGLPLVMQLLRKHKGFIRLRSGRLSLCADPSTHNDESTDPRLRDICGAAEPVRRAPVQGVLITIILPMRK